MANKALAPRDGQRRGRIKPAAEQHDSIVRPRRHHEFLGGLSKQSLDFDRRRCIFIVETWRIACGPKSKNGATVWRYGYPSRLPPNPLLKRALRSISRFPRAV